ncbi:MAG: DUF2911 domain-containing protein [Vicinamibacterales bacterium]|nr:DUF2911 domain-containing protein [Vicinamibacterales bacterium]
MKKQTVIVAVVAVLVAGIVSAGQATQQAPAAAQAAPQAAAAPRPPASPVGSAATQVGGTWAEPQPGAAPRYRDGKWIVVEYGRPILRGRGDVFGKGADYGKTVTGTGAVVWRAGANTTTRIRIEAPLVFGDKTLAPGEYSVFVDLKEGAWTFILSTQPYQQKYDRANKTDTFGAYNYSPQFDVVRVPMKVSAGGVTVDQFTIGFVNMTQQGGTLAMWWDTTMATVDFKVGQ